MRKLPYIHNQGRSPSCYKHAIAGCLEWHLWEKGIKVKLDAEEFHERIKRKHPFPMLGAGFEEMREVGLLGDDGNYYRAKNSPMSARKAFKTLRKEPLIATIESNDTHLNKMVKDGIYSPSRTRDHQVVITDYLDQYKDHNPCLLIANSYGEDWNYSLPELPGYFIFPLRHFQDRKNPRIYGFNKLILLDDKL